MGRMKEQLLDDDANMQAYEDDYLFELHMKEMQHNPQKDTQDVNRQSSRTIQ